MLARLAVLEAQQADARDWRARVETWFVTGVIGLLILVADVLLR